MAYIKVAEIVDSVKGAWIEYGTFTLDAASIAAAAQGVETVTIAGLATGDGVFINAQAAPAMAILAGCKVTDTDELSVYVNNAYDATTPLDMASLTFDVMIIHNS